MATCEEFLKWYERDLGSWGNLDTHAIVRESGGSTEGLTEVSIQIFTDTNRYSIRARNARPETELQQAHGAYLGCVATSRKPRAGEDWTRGNDLPDGPLTEATWHHILAKIVAYELVHVHNRDDSRPAVRCVPDEAEGLAQPPLARPFPGIAA